MFWLRNENKFYYALLTKRLCVATIDLVFTLVIACRKLKIAPYNTIKANDGAVRLSMLNILRMEKIKPNKDQWRSQNAEKKLRTSKGDYWINQ